MTTNHTNGHTHDDAVEAVRQGARRRTFAVISHPDAGKSTLTEALALHAHAISEAGHIHGKASRKSTVSDWMDMEQDRGISITSASLVESPGFVYNLFHDFVDNQSHHITDGWFHDFSDRSSFITSLTLPPSARPSCEA